MAQLALISAATKKETNAIGDIVGVFPDDHIFSEKELALFTIVKDVDPTTIERSRPEKRIVYFDTDNTFKVIDKNPIYELNYNIQNKTFSHNYTGTFAGKDITTVTTEITEARIAEEMIGEVVGK